MREGNITQDAYEDIQLVRSQMLGACVASVREVLLEATVDACNLGEMMYQSDLRIRGNRSGDTPMTWSDYRLILIADLKLLLTYLERNT